jgi:hypothetical protein
MAVMIAVSFTLVIDSDVLCLLARLRLRGSRYGHSRGPFFIGAPYAWGLASAFLGHWIESVYGKSEIS